MIQGVYVAMETRLRFPKDDQEKVLDSAWKLYADEARQSIVRKRVKRKKKKAQQREMGSHQGSNNEEVWSKSHMMITNKRV